MASTSESGHPINVANFDDLISYVTAYGATYNPPKASIKLAALQTVSTNIKAAVAAVHTVEPAYKNAVSARDAAFVQLSPMVTRIINSLKATDTTDQTIESVKTIVRKIQGKRATPKVTDAEKKAAEAAGKPIVEISSSQMGYDNRLDNFDKLIKLLTTVTLYAPNEADLKTTALTTVYTDLKTKNAAVISATIPLSNARIARNVVMYKDITGMFDLAADVKTYVKSVYGATSPQYKQISKIKFTKPR